MFGFFSSCFVQGLRVKTINTTGMFVYDTNVNSKMLKKARFANVIKILVF